MMGLTFEQPGVAWVVIPLILVVWLVRRWRRHRTYLSLSTADWIHRLGYTPSPIRRLSVMAAGAALGLTLVALLDPMVPSSDVQVSAQGLDIVLVMDLSSSMLEPMDFTPQLGPDMTPANWNQVAAERSRRKTRLETTKDALKDLIARRRGDRLGLVVFSEHPYLVSPLTFDHENLFRYVDLLDEQILRGEGMTAIGDGIALATQLLARQSAAEGKNKLIVVFTDGENNTGRDPLTSLKEADAAGLRVHMIGVDLEEEVKKRPAVLQLIITVRRLGGEYFHADTESDLRAAYERIDAMERGWLTRTAVVHHDPAYPWFTMPAAMLLLLAIGVRAIPFFSDLT
jgi:Ca-activated chloride channel family protein